MCLIDQGLTSETLVKSLSFTVMLFSLKLLMYFRAFIRCIGISILSPLLLMKTIFSRKRNVGTECKIQYIFCRQTCSIKKNQSEGFDRHKQAIVLFFFSVAFYSCTWVKRLVKQYFPLV